eukprot:4293708-Amphidinium_carterae.1
MDKFIDFLEEAVEDDDEDAAGQGFAQNNVHNLPLLSLSMLPCEATVGHAKMGMEPFSMLPTTMFAIGVS